MHLPIIFVFFYFNLQERLPIEGILCYNCQQQAAPDMCDDITLCGPDKVRLITNSVYTNFVLRQICLCHDFFGTRKEQFSGIHSRDSYVIQTICLIYTHTIVLNPTGYFEMLYFCLFCLLLPLYIVSNLNFPIYIKLFLLNLWLDVFVSKNEN